jgi:hypothetical protein
MAEFQTPSGTWAEGAHFPPCLASDRHVLRGSFFSKIALALWRQSRQGVPPVRKEG